MTDAFALATVAILVFAASSVFVRLFGRWSVQRNLLDHPNERSSHTVPTPRGGGLAIVVLTLLTSLSLVVLQQAPRSLLLWTAAGAAIALVSWIDDLRGVPNRIRFAVHVAAAAAGVFAFGSWTTVAVGGKAWDLGMAGVVLTVLWVVGLTNAWNFMDGIDGIAALAAILAVCAWITIFPLPATVAMGLPLAAATAGFLTLNWPPAKIFMGDVGSAFLGFTLALLPLSPAADHGNAPLLAVLPVWPFVFDTTFTILRRLRKRENIFVAHRSHLYQRLVIAGWSHASVTLLYGLLTALGGGAALAIVRGLPPSIAVAAVAVAAFSLWLATTYAERGAASRASRNQRA